MGTKATFFFFFTFFALCSSFPLERNYAPCKHLVLFFHDILYNGRNALNATSAIVAAPEGANLTKLANLFHFGNLVVFDDPVTLDNNLQSEPVGRAQGFYIYDSKNTFSACLGFTFVLNTTHHEGTITLAGADPTLKKTRDISVTGGTGDFFMHRGIATIMTDAFEASSHTMWFACCNNVIGSQFETMRTMKILLGRVYPPPKSIPSISSLSNLV